MPRLMSLVFPTLVVLILAACSQEIPLDMPPEEVTPQNRPETRFGESPGEEPAPTAPEPTAPAESPTVDPSTDQQPQEAQESVPVDPNQACVFHPSMEDLPSCCGESGSPKRSFPLPESPIQQQFPAAPRLAAAAANVGGVAG